MILSVVLLIGLAATLVVTLAFDWSLHSLGMALVLTASLVFLAVKAHLAKRQTEAVRRQLSDLNRLRVAYDQLDQQAKLIIRTDFELHQTQEELDRRLASLMSLHQLGRQLQVSLRPDEVFSKLDATIISNFGFSKGLLGLCPSLETVQWHSLVGVDSSGAAQLTAHLVESTLLKHILMHPAPTTLKATAVIDPAQRRLLELLGVPIAVVAGVIPHSGPAGCLLLGRAGVGGVNPKADEELVAILANQLASAVENSALYEATWTAQRELEQKVQERTRELAEANAQLLRLNKAKSDFVSMVSHELRTPLAAIKGYASLLASGQFGTLGKPQGERIEKIEKQADLLTRLINNLLDIARIESGRVTMERRVIPLEDFLSGVHDLVHPQMQAKRIRYSVDRDGVTELLGDAQHLQRVFLNLLSNAIKYTPEDGTIRVALARDGGSILTSVSDTGCGIPAEDLPKLFQEFYRANDAINQQVRGTGLGLALVKRIVEAHQGRIWVRSEKGKGSTFFVSLPAA
jgi:signal transduction histidine kinase